MRISKAIRLRIRKELTSSQQFDIIKLKGSIISNGFTEIIYIDDHDEVYHMNYFEISNENRDQVHNFISAFISDADLKDTVSIYTQ